MLLAVIFITFHLVSAGTTNYFSRLRNEGRIVGGRDADIYNYPYQVSFEFEEQHHCGASIISSEYVVTAAHCAIGKSISTVRFRAGSSFVERGGTLHPASSIVLHPSYNEDNNDYDIAVVKVSVRFTFGRGVQPIPMLRKLPPLGTPCAVTGWGTLSPGGAYPKKLQRVEVYTKDWTTCSRAYQETVRLTARMLCAGTAAGGRDACQSDSGGGLAAYGRLVGVVSFGIGCGEKEFPGVYADVTVLAPWITSVTGVQ